MNPFLFCSLANIIVVGIIASYADIRYGKIFNKIIARGFIAGFLILAVFFGRFFDSLYLKKVLINGFFSFAISYLFWVYKQWSAGDAKLFSFFAFFTPLVYYQKNYVQVVPAINILINVFAIIVVFIFASAVFFALREFFTRGKKIDFKINRLNGDLIFNLIKTAGIFCLIIYLTMLSGKIRFLSPLFTNGLLMFFFMFFIFRPLFAYQKLSDTLFVLSMVLLTYLFSFQREIAVLIFSRAMIYVGAIGAIRYCLGLYITHAETIKVKVRDLKRGQVLTENEIYKIRQSIPEEEKDGFNEMAGYGLYPGQIKIIKRLFPEEDSLTAYKTLCMGPFMFGAVIATMLTSNLLIKVIIERLSNV